MDNFTDNNNKKAVIVDLLNVEDRGADVFINYEMKYSDGTSKICRKNVKQLAEYSDFLTPGTIKYARSVGKVYCGIVKTDVRLVFIATMSDGSVELLQAREGSQSGSELFKLCSEPKKSAFNSLQPYELKKNELPQGEYIIGKDIPEGTFDFFVVYGSGGKFDKTAYDANGERIASNQCFYHVGMKEEDKNKELIHIVCKSGEIIKIFGNVVLKIVRSQRVQIDL